MRLNLDAIRRPEVLTSTPSPTHIKTGVLFESMRSKGGNLISLPDMTLSFWCMVSAHRTCSNLQGWGKIWAKLCGTLSFDMIFRRMHFSSSFFDDTRYVIDYTTMLVILGRIVRKM